jgi:hypothetical protein
LIEENSTIQTQLLIESIILNEGLIELSKKFGKKIALGMLILKMFDLNPNIEKPDIDNPISFKAPGIERIINQAKETFENHSNEKVDNIDPVQAVKAAEANNKLQSINEEDFNNSFEITRALLSVFGESFEGELEKLEYSIKSDILSRLDIEQIFMSVCNDLKFSMSSIAALSFDFISIDTLTTDENVIDDIENLINILEETSKNLHDHKNHSH